MANTIPHLHRDRLGTFYFRITVAGRTSKKSLRTKDAQLATMRAACLNWELHHMPTPSVADILKAHQEGRIRKFDVVLPGGVELKNVNTDDDARRVGELLARVKNVRREGGIDYFAITAGKTTSSLRNVPFHKAIKASGFMAYLAERRQEEPGGMLFPELRPTKNGYVKNVSRRFNEQHLRELRIDQPTKRLVSFRHTFITRMSESNVHPAMLMAIVGHYEQDAVDLNSPHFKGYNGAKKLTALRDTIDKFAIKLPTVF